MKHVCIALPEGAASVGCIEGAATLFNVANDFLINAGKDPLFTVRFVGIDKQPKNYQGLFSLQAHHQISEQFPCDLIILPAVNGDMETNINNNRALTGWAASQYLAGAELASLCVGSFLLASTGLLEGKKCSTHWMAESEFRSMFPSVKLVSHKIITDENGLYSSGGANSFWNLLLYIVEKYTDRDLAIALGKYFEIDTGRQNQNAFIIFQGQKKHEDNPIKKAQEFIEENYREKLSVEKISDMLAMGKRSLERRFKNATCYTVSEYIQRVKMEVAKKRLESGRVSIAEVMYEVGYSDNKTFRAVFRKHTGLSPLEYRNKYRRPVAA